MNDALLFFFLLIALLLTVLCLGIVVGENLSSQRCHSSYRPKAGRHRKPRGRR